MDDRYPLTHLGYESKYMASSGSSDTKKENTFKQESYLIIIGNKFWQESFSMKYNTFLAINLFYCHW